MLENFLNFLNHLGRDGASISRNLPISTSPAFGRASRGSGVFTKKYHGASRTKARRERIKHWHAAHGWEKAQRIMREQGDL